DVELAIPGRSDTDRLGEFAPRKPTASAPAQPGPDFSRERPSSRKLLTQVDGIASRSYCNPRLSRYTNS
ncbi:MAG: hypothetical protein VX757_08630, partial [Planctomycetota bacterium]|nr:hypothetical protein [Planctomycetota bacterium]